MIQLIREDSLKSAELTGQWEKKLREIEHHTYDAKQFLDELKQMVVEIVKTVMQDNSNRRVAITELNNKKIKETVKTDNKVSKPKSPKKKKNSEKQELKPSDSIIGSKCPICGRGIIVKGKTAYGCSEWKSGCTFRLFFQQNQ